jgi:hypothetical protein
MQWSPVTNTVQVFAKDSGTGAVPTMTKVAIRVIDVNDNAPRIVLNDRAGDAEVTVEEEGTAGSFVAHISVSDADSGSNGAVQCALMESDEFTMERLYDGEYKVRTSRSLDREARADYELEIICHDGGSPQRTTSARLRVRVADINDNPPKFLQEEYFGVVAEGGDSGMYVVRCDASDPDGGRNGTVRYRLDRDAGSVFTIDSQTGIIRTTMAVDQGADGGVRVSGSSRRIWEQSSVQLQPLSP